MGKVTHAVTTSRPNESTAIALVVGGSSYLIAFTTESSLVETNYLT